MTTQQSDYGLVSLVEVEPDEPGSTTGTVVAVGTDIVGLLGLDWTHGDSGTVTFKFGTKVYVRTTGSRYGGNTNIKGPDGNTRQSVTWANYHGPSRIYVFCDTEHKYAWLIHSNQDVNIGESRTINNRWPYSYFFPPFHFDSFMKGLQTGLKLGRAVNGRPQIETKGYSLLTEDGHPILAENGNRINVNQR